MDVWSNTRVGEIADGHMRAVCNDMRRMNVLNVFSQWHPIATIKNALYKTKARFWAGGEGVRGWQEA